MGHAHHAHGRRRGFPVLHDHRTAHHPECPRWLPWDLVEPVRHLAHRAHGQTLEQLADRGGLDPIELRNLYRRERVSAEPGGALDMAHAAGFVMGLRTLRPDPADPAEPADPAPDFDRVEAARWLEPYEPTRPGYERGGS